MVEKIGFIKNPLTIIAIFAAIAEISGTVILPFIASANQAVYVWFLMIFPTLLITLFFLTLNFNHKVLYAPSDYKNEDNFLHSLPRATFAERVLKIEAELAEETLATSSAKPDEHLPKLGQHQTVNKTSAGNDVSVGSIAAGAVWVAADSAAAATVVPTGAAGGDAASPAGVVVTDLIGEADTRVADVGRVDAIAAAEASSSSDAGFIGSTTAPVRREQAPQQGQISALSPQVTYMLAEEVVFKKLRKEFSSNIHREVKLGQSGRLTFDGIVNDKGVTTIIEVKVIRNSAHAMRRVRDTVLRIQESIEFLPPDEARNLRLLFAIILADSNAGQEQLATQVDRYRSHFQLPIEVRFFKLDELQRDFDVAAYAE